MIEPLAGVTVMPTQVSGSGGGVLGVGVGVAVGAAVDVPVASGVTLLAEAGATRNVAPSARAAIAVVPLAAQAALARTDGVARWRAMSSVLPDPSTRRRPLGAVPPPYAAQCTTTTVSPTRDQA